MNSSPEDLSLANNLYANRKSSVLTATSDTIEQICTTSSMVTLY